MNAEELDKMAEEAYAKDVQYIGMSANITYKLGFKAGYDKAIEENCEIANKILDGWCRNKDDYCPHLKALEEQINKMKCCGNCKHSEEDNKSSTVCYEWEMKE